MRGLSAIGRLVRYWYGDWYPLKMCELTKKSWGILCGDYWQPLKTNQIFTPKTMVKKMADMLETENPGCFDDPDKTFIDLYMKSGLYITEIVKRLYQSKYMQEQFPDPKEHLRHIFEKQVYGLAPPEIIYHIALSYILGFNEDTKDIKHNFRQLDALPYAKEGTLQQKLDKLFA